jgi:hypothetical protein
VIEIQNKTSAPRPRLLGTVAVGERALRDFARQWATDKPLVAAALELALPQAEVTRWVRMAKAYGVDVREIGRVSVASGSTVRSVPIGLGWAHVLITHPLAGGAAKHESPFVFVRRTSASASLLPGELRRFFAALDAAVAVPLQTEWASTLWSEAVNKGGMVQNCWDTGRLEGWLVRGDSNAWGAVVAKLLAQGRISVQGGTG